MKINRRTDDKAKEIQQAIKDNGGYCCCAIEKSIDTRCICKDFIDKVEDPSFEGECNCGLYYIER